MNNQCLYKLCVLGLIFSFLPFFNSKSFGYIPSDDDFADLVLE